MNDIVPIQHVRLSAGAPPASPGRMSHAVRRQELDDAVRRRLTKRIYIPLPDAEGRLAVLSHLLKVQWELRVAGTTGEEGRNAGLIVRTPVLGVRTRPPVHKSRVARILHP